MAKGDIVSVSQRRLTDEEGDVLAWIETQEIEAIPNLEAGARQIITLVTAFYGVIFGVLALGRDAFEATLNQPATGLVGFAAIVLLLAALGAALVVVMPRSYRYGEKRLDEMKAAYRQMVAHKATWLRFANILFGLGLTMFAVLILVMLAGRL